MPRRKKSSLLEDLIDIVSMLPWWAGVALAPVCYLLTHAWAVRLANEMVTKPQVASGIYYAFASIGQYVLPIVCLVGAVVSALRRKKRNALAGSVAAARSADVLDRMTWREFELLVGEGFRAKGFQVEELGGSGADGGVDLILRKGREKHLVQCKQWRAYKVGVQVVRELYGVMAASGATGGYVVTSGRFTDEAREFVKGRNVDLMDGDAVFTLIRSVREGNGDVRSRGLGVKDLSGGAGGGESMNPSCPQCAGKMVQRTAGKGTRVGESFWGCASFPRCRGMRNFDSQQ